MKTKIAFMLYTLTLFLVSFFETSIDPKATRKGIAIVFYTVNYAELFDFEEEGAF